MPTSWEEDQCTCLPQRIVVTYRLDHQSDDGMLLRRWDRIQQGRRDSLPIFRHGFRDEIKHTTDLVNGILELENKIGEQVGENFQDVYQPDTRKLDVTQA